MAPHKDVDHRTRHQVSNNWRLFAERRLEPGIDAELHRPHAEESHDEKKAAEAPPWSNADESSKKPPLGRRHTG